MLRFLLFETLFLGATGYALVRGGWAERSIAVVCLLNFGLTPVLSEPIASAFAGFPLRLFLIDLTALLAIAVIAVRSDRYWPIWMAGMQGATVAAHLAALTPLINAWTYHWAEVILSYPQLCLLAVATWRHRRSGPTANGI